MLLKTPNASDISDIKADVDGFTLSGEKAPANTTIENIESITAGVETTKVTLKAVAGYKFAGNKKTMELSGVTVNQDAYKASQAKTSP